MKKFSLPRVAAACLALTASLAAAPAPVAVNWLGNAPSPVATGVSWGVPWPKGAVPRDQKFTLTDAAGHALPVQSWPLAYWPDGSMKWTGFATVAGARQPGPFQLAPGEPAESTAKIVVRPSDTTLEIDTGPLQCRVLKWGANLIDSIAIDGREVARHGELVCLGQDGPDNDADVAPRRERFVGRLHNVTVEQAGPVRAVLKLEGTHRAAGGSREWLPFVVRLYFYAGQKEIRLVHTIIYNGDEQRDFIRGLGVEFGVPLREEIQNRQVRFSGENGGLWSEPVQPLTGRGATVNFPDGKNAYFAQLEGQRVPNRREVSEHARALLSDWAVWDSFRLVQPNADGFSIVKRTNPQSAWIAAGAGRRASGYAFVGDVSGGLGVTLKNFWQSHPTSLEVANASTGEATLRVWLWSPDAAAMDLRHYDTRAHGLDAVYEDVQDGLSTPFGVARTSEMILSPSADVPPRDASAQAGSLAAQLPVLTCSPEYLHSVRAFGLWSLPDRSTPYRTAIEDELDSTVNFYLRQVEERHWYGFWDFGDVMHSYDAPRHVWRYDMGGFAWDNTELGTDMWLWTSFLRSGRPEIFRMAEALTRHTSEVDCYHLGPMAGFGSRHNVRHWGCGAKEARISMAGLKRFYYYLTTDERTGDLMHEVARVDAKAADFDSMRLAQPITEAEKKYPARIRVGPDWLAFVSDWATEWERTGDPRWRDRILAGVDSMAAMPFGMRSGRNLVMGYDPATGKLYQVSDEPGRYNLTTIQGGAEVIFELNESLDSPAWEKLWLQYCRLGNAPGDVLIKDKITGNEGADASLLGELGGSNSQGTPRLAAYAYWKTKDAAFAKFAVKAIVRYGTRPVEAKKIDGAESLDPVDEDADVSTNAAAQGGLTAIEVLELCGDQLPHDLPPPEPRPRGPRGNREGGNGRPAPPPSPGK